MKKEKIHPYIPELVEQYQKDKISRREFLRYAGLLGMSLASASSIIDLSRPKALHAANIQRGGTLRVAANVQKVSHLSTISWTAARNAIGNVAEFLTYSDGNNITHPYLLKNWKVSDDLKTWTLNVRKGVKFNNGDTFTAEDVIFTMNQWMDKNVGSSMLGLLGSYLSPTGIEKSGEYQVTLHLDRPEIAVPEHFYHFPAMVFNHKTFEGDFIKRPHGTGPYTLKAYEESGRCLLKRRNDYWQKGADGQLLPYMDAIEFIDMGTEMAPQIAAIQSGEIDMIELSVAAGPDVFQAAKSDPNVMTYGVATAQARVLRMRVDLEPWSDNRVRLALKNCLNREKILALAYFGEGVQAADYHVYPGHPEHCEKPIPKYDPQKAKQLLKEAGYPKGLDVKLAVSSDWTDVVRIAEIVKKDAAPSGLRISIESMPTSKYWEIWLEVPFGITPWNHRPLGTMALNLGYTSNPDGKPVRWNETRWVDKEFNQLLKQANQTIDVDERRKIFCKLEDIQRARGSVGISFWRNVWTVARKRCQNVIPHPSTHLILNDVWLKKS